MNLAAARGCPWCRGPGTAPEREGAATAYRATVSNRNQNLNRKDRRERCYESVGCTHSAVGGLAIGVWCQGRVDAPHDWSGRAGGDVGSGVPPGRVRGGVSGCPCPFCRGSG